MCYPHIQHLWSITRLLFLLFMIMPPNNWTNGHSKIFERITCVVSKTKSEWYTRVAVSSTTDPSIKLASSEMIAMVVRWVEMIGLLCCDGDDDSIVQDVLGFVRFIVCIVKYCLLMNIYLRICDAIGWGRRVKDRFKLDPMQCQNKKETPKPYDYERYHNVVHAMRVDVESISLTLLFCTVKYELWGPGFCCLWIRLQ